MATKTKFKAKRAAVITAVVIAAVLGMSYSAQRYQSAQQIKRLRALITEQFNIDSKTKTANCKTGNSLPDHDCTPGAVLSNITKSQVCSSGYSSSVRNVPVSEKNQVYAEYGIATRAAGQYEVDHFISLELGGSNDIANLWPEAATPVPGFHEKDQVENFLHDKLCSNAINLPEAQYLISSKWLEVYNLIK